MANQLDYVEELSYRMASSLLGTDLRRGIEAAALGLGCIHEDELPAALAVEHQILERAVTKAPGTPAEGQGLIAATVAALPEGRLHAIAERFLRFYGDVMRASGASSTGDIALQKETAELGEAEKWEFLDWGCGPGATASEKAAYAAYAKNFLPYFPDDVLTEWLLRHNHAVRYEWGHLRLDRMRFRCETWSDAQVLQVQARDSHWTTVGDKSKGGYALVHTPDEWLTAYMRKNGTWPVPVIILDNKKSSLNDDRGRSLPSPYALVEGHRRLSLLVNLVAQQASSGRHPVHVLDVV